MDELWQLQVRERALAIRQREGSPDSPIEQFEAIAEAELIAEGQTPSATPLDEEDATPPDGERV